MNDPEGSCSVSCAGRPLRGTFDMPPERSGRHDNRRSLVTRSESRPARVRQPNRPRGEQRAVLVPPHEPQAARSVAHATRRRTRCPRGRTSRPGLNARSRLTRPGHQAVNLRLPPFDATQVEVLTVLRGLALQHTNQRLGPPQPAGSTQARSWVLSSSTFDPRAAAQKVATRSGSRQSKVTDLTKDTTRRTYRRGRRRIVWHPTYLARRMPHVARAGVSADCR